MDITTLIGIVSGVGMVLIAIFMGGGLSIFINVTSMMITMGGTIGATLINFPFSKVIGVASVVKNAFFHKEIPPDEVIKSLVGFATIARREGLLALEEKISTIHNSFLLKGIQLAIDGTPLETIRDILRTDIDYLESRHKIGQDIFTAMGTYAPAFGMIGTLIGLIQMLRKLDDPSKIGQGMATALITTFYGALFANLICLPIAGKLKIRSEEEIFSRELIIEGILSIQSGDNPRIVEEKLKAFIAPRLREKIKVEKK